MAVIYVNGLDKLPPRKENDFYPTPLGFCRAALQQLPRFFTPRAILDPGAGTGVWGKAYRERWPQSLITGVELRDVARPGVYNFWYTGDMLQLATPAPCFDLIAGNPPFNIAEPLVRAGLAMLDAGGYLMFLLRLAFLEGQGRGTGLWREFPPFKVVVSSKRIGFTGNSNPNSFALFIWKQGYRGESQLGWMTHADTAMEDASQSTHEQLKLFEVA